MTIGYGMEDSLQKSDDLPNTSKEHTKALVNITNVLHNINNPNECGNFVKNLVRGAVDAGNDQEKWNNVFNNLVNPKITSTTILRKATSTEIALLKMLLQTSVVRGVNFNIKNSNSEYSVNSYQFASEVIKQAQVIIHAEKDVQMQSCFESAKQSNDLLILGMVFSQSGFLNNNILKYITASVIPSEIILRAFDSNQNKDYAKLRQMLAAQDILLQQRDDKLQQLQQKMDQELKKFEDILVKTT